MSAGPPMDEAQAMIDDQAPISQQLDADGQALLEAAEQGDAATVRALLAAGLDPNAAWQPGTSYSALHLAAAGGHVSTIMTLLVFGASLDDSTAAEAVTPLRLAVQGRHVPAIQVLLGAGASGVAEGLLSTADDRSALAHALGTGDFPIVKLLLQLGLSPGEECGRALVTAAGEGQLATVEALLAAGVPADCAVYDPVWYEEGGEEHEDEPRTALMAAAQGGHTAVMRCLLAAGADMEARWWTFCYEDLDEPEHLTALEVCGTAEAARVLLEAGAAVQDPARDYFPLITYIVLSNEDIISVLLEAGADPNATDEEGYTALYSAVSGDLAKAVASLLAAGADANPNSPSGFPMHAARSIKVALMLLRAGADIHAARDCDGRTPLICAAHYRRGDVIEALLAAGASVHATDKDGNTALHTIYAAPGYFTNFYNKQKFGRIAELLCAAGADINATNKAGETPLALAVGRGVETVVTALIAAGAAPSTEVLAQALRRPGLRGSWMTVLLPSRSIRTQQLREWAGAAFSGRPDAKQAMFWGVWALRRRLPAELLRLIAALCCMLE